MLIVCKRCGAAHPVESGRTHARCERCRAVVFLERRYPEVERIVPLPASMRIVEDGRPLLPDAGSYRALAQREAPVELAIVHRWFRVGRLVAVVFCSFVLSGFGLVVGGIVGSITHPYAVFGVLGTIWYVALALLVNRTVVAVREGKLSVRHGPLPLPWPRSVTLAADRLAQLYCREASEGDGAPTYSVEALLSDGANIALVAGLPEPDQARFLEKILESRLGIEDRPVGGELSP